MPLVEANGVRLHVQELGGDGPAVVMLHGILVDTLATWYFTAAPALARSRRVVLVDWRGHGLSEHVPDGYGLRSLAADLAALVDRLDLAPVSVVGFSFGGSVALRYACDHLDAIDRVAVVDSPLPLVDSDELSLFDLDLGDVDLGREGQEAWLSVLPDRQRALLPRNGRRIRRVFGQFSRLYAETSLRADLRREPDIADAELARLTRPVLLVYGARSTFGASRDRLERVLPDARAVLLDGGHFLPLEAQHELTAELEGFLRA